jgi:hypothetical protein
MGSQDRQAWINYRDNHPGGRYGDQGGGFCGLIVLGSIAGALAILGAVAKGWGWV